MHHDVALAGHHYPNSRWPSRRPRPLLRGRKLNSSRSCPAWSSAVSSNTAWSRLAPRARRRTLTNQRKVEVTALRHDPLVRTP